MTLKSLHFSLSSACSGRCVFCPRPVTPPGTSPFAAPAMVEKALREAAAYPVELIDVGESGDALLNPDFLDILRLVRRLSAARVRLFTNFSSFTPARADTVLEEGLLDVVVTNIDGATAGTYRAVKGLDLDRVTRHVRHFLDRRRTLGSGVEFRVQSLTMGHYVGTVREVLGRDPQRVKADDRELPDDFEEIVAQWAAEGVRPERSLVALWGEREPGGKNRIPWARRVRSGRFRKKPCRLLDRIRTSLFVSPTGVVHLCCADFAFELVIGDVTRQTVGEIFEGERRRELVRALAGKRFEEIGGPCAAPEFCRFY